MSGFSFICAVLDLIRSHTVTYNKTQVSLHQEHHPPQTKSQMKKWEAGTGHLEDNIKNSRITRENSAVYFSTDCPLGSNTCLHLNILQLPLGAESPHEVQNSLTRFSLINMDVNVRKVFPSRRRHNIHCQRRKKKSL